MRIVFGTDFSADAAAAADVAASLASRGGYLCVVHAFDSGLLSLLDENRRDYVLSRLKKKLSSEAKRLRSSGAKVSEKLAAGAPQRVLAEWADQSGSNLIAATSRRTSYPGRWLGGSVTERVAQSAAVPTLSIRKREPLMAWAKGKHTLNVFVCCDFSASSDAALEWVASLMKMGPCLVTVSHVLCPPQGLCQVGRDSSSSRAEDSPGVQKVFMEELKKRAHVLRPGGNPTLRVLESEKEPADQLVQLAELNRADLIVAGKSRMTGPDRFWLGSVSREILYRAQTNVVCVPAASSRSVPQTAPRSIKRSLVSTATPILQGRTSRAAACEESLANSRFEASMAPGSSHWC